MQFTDINQLKEFLLWCQSQAIEHVRIGETEVKFNQLAFLHRLTEAEQSTVAKEERNTSRTLMDTLPADENDDELLFHSARG